MHMRAFAWRQALALALTFGVFQAAMPVIGWALGSALAGTIVAYDHWVAFGLLAAIGAKMMWESRGVTDEGHEPRPAIRTRELLILGIATSIDALAVGVSFAFLDVNVVTAAITIGIVTAGLSLLGVWLGHYAGRRLASCAELIGGLVLVGIGVKILADHLTA
ncbi:MAG: manganese efflux pump [Demequinaceae bacterium]|nr:manganese efflux pump [Demequinaceae bacterium]